MQASGTMTAALAEVDSADEALEVNNRPAMAVRPSRIPTGNILL